MISTVSRCCGIDDDPYNDLIWKSAHTAACVGSFLERQHFPTRVIENHDSTVGNVFYFCML